MPDSFCPWISGPGASHRRLVLLLAVGLLLAAPLLAAADRAVNIPRLDGVTIDGSPADWGDRGFRVNILPDASGRLLPADDLDAALRLGWSDQGLLALVTVTDNAPSEHPAEDNLWEADSVELFLSPDWSREGVAQFITSPGLDPQFPSLRTRTYDQRSRRDTPLKLEAAVTKTDRGYVFEALLPWSNVQVTPSLGTEVGFQVLVNDRDDPGDRIQAAWVPLTTTGSGSRASHLLRLSDAPSPPVVTAVQGSYERMRRIRVSVAAAGSLAGKTAELRAGAATLASTTLAPDGGRASARLDLPLPKPGQLVPALEVFIAGAPIAALDLPDLARARARAAVDLRVSFDPYVFDSASFPPCDFEHPNLAEDLLGPYTIKTTFYDADYRPVTRAEKPGRYGAVVEVIPEEGASLRFFRTLFRIPPGALAFGWHPRASGFSIGPPDLPGANPAVVAEQSQAISDFLWSRLQDGFGRDPGAAAVFAAIYASKPTGAKATVEDDLFAQDLQWWVGLKRKLYGLEDAYPAPFVCPRPLDGPPAPVLRKGTPQEAGMKPDAAAKIDAVLQEWAADTDESFAVCIARRGVIVLHKAYGQREGAPMAVTDKSWMASITKLLSATLMMMAVDQGRVSLDDTVDRFLPPFRGVQVETPLTLRHLYTHTNGLWDHWGDSMADFDEIIGRYYPHLEIGKEFSYNGAGYTLAGRILELVSGESLPLFYKHHLLDPLGCQNIDVFGMSWDAMAAPLDIAKVGQLLLNRGAYGDMRFLREETFRQMLPERLTKVLGPDTTEERGIGMHEFGDEPFGKGTFGHGAASSATWRIDPVNDLVVVMTRNTAGRNFGKYHPLFLKAILDGIAEAP